MANQPNKSTVGANTGAALDTLSAAIIQAIESGFGSVVGQVATTGSLVGPENGTNAPAPSGTVAGGSSIVEEPGGVGPKGEGNQGGETKFRGVKKDGWSGYFGALKSGLFEEENSFAIGYPALEVGTALGKRYNELNSGQFVSPYEREASLTEAVAPGVGGIMGALIGGAAGPGGAVLGSFIGNGAGEIVSSVVDAKDKRDEIAATTSDRLAASLGAVAETAERFKSQLEATGAPLAQLASGVTVLQGMGPGVGAQAVAGLGRAALAEGEFFDQDTAQVGKFLTSNPTLYQAKQRFITQGTDLSKAEDEAIAGLALTEGDMDTFNSASMKAARRANEDDPLYMKDVKVVSTASEGVIGHAETGLRKWEINHVAAGSTLSRVLGLDNDPTDQAIRYVNGKDAKAGEEAKGQEQADIAESLAIGRSRSDRLTSETQANRAIGEYRYEALGSASPEDLAKRLPGIQKSLDDEAAADEGLITVDAARRDELIKKKDPKLQPIIDSYNEDIAKLRDDEIEKPNIVFRTLAKENFVETFKGREAGFGLDQLRAQLEGKSAAEIQQATRRESDFLQGVENDPQSPLSPADKAEIEKSRISLNYQSRLAVGEEALSQIDLRTTQAEAKVSWAQADSGPEEVYHAQEGVLSTYTARIKELTEELHAGGLAVSDRISKEKELATTQGQAAQLEAASREALYAGRHGIAEDTLGTMTDGLSRQIAIGGNQAVTAQMVGEAQHSITIATDALALAKTPGEKARLSRAITDDTLQRDQLETARETYTPTAETTLQDITLAGTSQRAARLGGQAAQDAAQARVTQDQRELTDVQAAQRTARDPLARVANAQKEQAYLTDIAERKTEAQSWSLTPEQQAKDIEETGSLHRSMLLLYQDGGVNIDPLTRGNELIKEKEGLLKSAKDGTFKDRPQRPGIREEHSIRQQPGGPDRKPSK